MANIVNYTEISVIFSSFSVKFSVKLLEFSNNFLAGLIQLPIAEEVVFTAVIICNCGKYIAGFTAALTIDWYTFITFCKNLI